MVVLRYFLTIVDDYSRFTWVYLLKSKFNVNSIFHAFCTLIHTQFGANINQFIVIMHPNLLFLDYFCKKGIFPFHSCVDTPQQNFAVERKHQTPFECGPSIIVSIQYSSSLLGWLHFNCYLSHKISSPILSNKTPFEIFYYRVISVSLDVYVMVLH